MLLCVLLQNMNTDMIEAERQNTFVQYLYIVIPLVISLLVVSIDCVVSKWLHKRKKINPWTGETFVSYSDHVFLILYFIRKPKCKCLFHWMR